MSITYAAAAEQVIDEPLPVGLGLRVPVPRVPPPLPAQPMYFATLQPQPVAVPVVQKRGEVVVGEDGLCDFDDLEMGQVRGFFAFGLGGLWADGGF